MISLIFYIDGVVVFLKKVLTLVWIFTLLEYETNEIDGNANCCIIWLLCVGCLQCDEYDEPNDIKKLVGS